MTPDMTNGLFEIASGLLCCLNIAALRRDKTVQGIHWLPTTVFTLWGFWNLFYYPHLEQWFSFAGGVVLVSVNLTWLSLVLFYSTRSKAVKST